MGRCPEKWTANRVADPAEPSRVLVIAKKRIVDEASNVITHITTDIPFVGSREAAFTYSILSAGVTH
ncbi:unnamed protein product [Gongylonema pulchrum]|uniref:Uncharacterized protein n=1 Tax=Gongylonema pulchrum TaxID=637853 RepID=A0A183DN11_9BILA|nr:unnamed protein product [Gongylonema pulchrum]